MQSNPSSSIQTHKLSQVIRLFLLLGTVSFGGPAAHIALMEREVVQKRGWVSRDEFMGMLAITNLVPGPNAAEMAIHIGFKHAGWAGLVGGGVAFILPAALLSLILAMVYQQLGALPKVLGIFYGIYPVVLAVILQAAYRFGRTALKDWRMIVLSAVCFAAAWLQINEVLVILGAGLISLVIEVKSIRLPAHLLALAFLPGMLPATAWSNSLVEDRLVQLTLFFLKVGSLIFGSGMVLFAFIQNDVVSGYGWLTEQQLLDAIAVGQITPGPVLSSATFIGYLVAGLPGALAATVAIFLPAFLIIAAICPWLPKISKYPPVKHFLRGVNAAVVAIIVLAALKLAPSAVVDLRTGLIGIAGLVILMRYKINSAWLILGGGVLGLIFLQLA